MNQKRRRFKTFNDGLVLLYKVGNIAEEGDMPKDGLMQEQMYRFHYETIGVQRNYTAMQNDVKLSELISIPKDRSISPLDVAIINGKQYEIMQVQHIDDTLPPTSKLSLRKIEENYDIKRV